MRPWWLVGLFALGACDEPPARPNPFGNLPAAGAPGSGGGGGSALVPPTVPLRLYQWSACGTIPGVKDEPTFAVPLAGTATAVGLASGALRLYRDQGPPHYQADGESVELKAGGLGLGEEPQFSPDGTLWAELSEGIVRLRWTADGRSLRDVVLQNPPCGRSLRFAPDGKHVVLFGVPATCVIDVESGRLITRVEGAYGPVGYADAQLFAWSATALTKFDVIGRPIADVSVPVEAEPERWTILSPRGDRLARRRKDGELVLYDLSNGDVLTSYAVGADAFDSAVFSPDGALVLSGDRVLQTADGSVLTQLAWLPGKPARAALSNDGLRVAFWGGEEDPHHPTLIDLGTGKPVRAFGGHTGAVVGIAASPDGTHFATTSGQTLLSWRLAASFEASVPEWTGDAGHEVYAQYSADSASLAVSGEGRAVFAADGPRLFAPPSSTDCRYSHFAFSKDGRWLAGGGGDFMVDVFDAVTYALVAQLPSSSCNSTAAFSPDGEFLATGAAEIYRTADWSLVSPETVTPLHSNQDDAPMNGAVFMPNARELLVSRCMSGSQPGFPSYCDNRLWTAGGRPEGTIFSGNGSRPDFSPEGDWLVAGEQVTAIATGLAHRLGPGLVSAFLPNGDIIGATPDGSIIRFCRSE